MRWDWAFRFLDYRMSDRTTGRDVGAFTDNITP